MGVGSDTRGVLAQCSWEVCMYVRKSGRMVIGSARRGNDNSMEGNEKDDSGCSLLLR